jgi:hypothetical protein
MQRCRPSFRNCSLLSLLAGLAVLLQAHGCLAQTVAVTSKFPTTVWKYSFPGTACLDTDYPDVPARPFLVGLFGQSILWFAANASGSYASVGTGVWPDMLASLQRGTARGAGCISWLPAALDRGGVPNSYNNAFWMAAPFVSRTGTDIHALVHNEFHGEWAGNPIWCDQQIPNAIYLPCNYWNIVSALSHDGGQSFQLLRQPSSPGANRPAIALGRPYQKPEPPASRPVNLPQGLVAQSNVLQIGLYYYVLAQQLPYMPPGSQPPATDVCLYRAAVPIPPAADVVWKGWGGKGYTVAVPSSYPAGEPQPLCQPTLGAPFRFSWSYNVFLNQLVIVGQDQLAAMAQKGISTEGCPVAPQVTSPDSAFVYMTANLNEAGELVPRTAEKCLLQITSMASWQNDKSLTGQAYPSLLDPASPRLVRDDRNFQYSGVLPFLYYTQLNPIGTEPGFDRDLVRLPLFVTSR